jgi:hypothetical protein
MTRIERISADQIRENPPHPCHPRSIPDKKFQMQNLVRLLFFVLAFVLAISFGFRIYSGPGN